MPFKKINFVFSYYRGIHLHKMNFYLMYGLAKLCPLIKMATLNPCWTVGSIPLFISFYLRAPWLHYWLAHLRCLLAASRTHSSSSIMITSFGGRSSSRSSLRSPPSPPPRMRMREFP